MAVNHLAALGHRRIAHIAGPQDLSTGRSRYLGFVSAMAASGLPVDPGLVVFAERFTLEEGQRCCRELLELPERAPPWRPATTCSRSAATPRWTRPAELPRDLSVVGFNDMPFIDLLKPPADHGQVPALPGGTEARSCCWSGSAAGRAGQDPLPGAGVHQPRLHRPRRAAGLIGPGRAPHPAPGASSGPGRLVRPRASVPARARCARAAGRLSLQLAAIQSAV